MYLPNINTLLNKFLDINMTTSEPISIKSSKQSDKENNRLEDYVEPISIKSSKQCDRENDILKDYVEPISIKSSKKKSLYDEVQEEIEKDNKIKERDILLSSFQIQFISLMLTYKHLGVPGMDALVRICNLYNETGSSEKLMATVDKLNVIDACVKNICEKK